LQYRVFADNYIKVERRLTSVCDDVQYVTMQWANQYNNLRTRRSATSRMRATPPLAATCPQSDDD